MSQRPAARVPAIAPAVFVAYKRLTRPPRPPERASDDFTINGRLAPRSGAGTSRTAKDSTKRTTVSSAVESGSSAATLT
jgi:hypothetical protein